MIYTSSEMEQSAVLQAAALMCAAARTAPKAKGVDSIHTAVLTDADKDAVAEFAGIVVPLVQNPQKLKQMSEAISKMALPHAAEKIVDRLEDIIQNANR